MCSSYKRVLLASHGTLGARAAERLALSIADEVHHLFVTPEFWKGMLGDDWLNNAAVQDQFGTYLEGQLSDEVQAELGRVRDLAGDCKLTQSAVLGKPDEALIEAARQGDYDLVVLGSSRPKGVPGLRSKMLTHALNSQLSVPMLVAPHPDVII